MNVQYFRMVLNAYERSDERVVPSGEDDNPRRTLLLSGLLKYVSSGLCTQTPASMSAYKKQHFETGRVTKVQKLCLAFQ